MEKRPTTLLAGQEGAGMFTEPSADISKMQSVHPWDPHPPNSSHLLPESIRPYPSFEGWFFRIVDPQNAVSIGLIIGTNYATSQSQATILFCLPGGFSSTNYNTPEGHTHRIYVMTKDAKITRVPRVQENNHNLEEPLGFDWEAPEIGKIVARPNKTNIDICVKGHRLNANLTSEVHWNSSHSYKGPEGWASMVPILPTHWYVYSVGSKACYEFNIDNRIDIKGQGWAHEEKNWGETFPAGHIWLQAISNDNDAQLVCSGAYFKVGDFADTPYIFAMGYRSPNRQIDMRTNDIGTMFRDISIDSKKGQFSIKAINPSYTIQITSSAAPESFSEPLLAPVGKLDWKPACRESYLANVQVEVYDHVVWGIPIDKKLVASQTFSYAALEFGEDLFREG